MSLNLKEYIQVSNVEFPEGFLQDIIDTYGESMKSVQFPNDPKQSIIKNMSIASLSTKKDDPKAKMIDDVIFKQVTELVKKYNEQFQYMKFKKDRGYHLIKIDKEGYHRSHVDNDKGITIIIQLHDKNDGQLTFFDGKYNPKLRQNQAVVFPSNFTYPWSFDEVKKDQPAYYIYTILNE